MIFNIQRFSIHDGIGIRTLIFYKGCPLRCQWCSNPESHSFGPDLLYDNRVCKKFGDCLRIEKESITEIPGGIQINRPSVIDPAKYRNGCASKALTVSGEDKSADELLIEIEKDTPFYNGNGGVTLSGGEPLAQGPELVLLLKKLKRKNIDVTIETCLHVSWVNVERCLDLVSVFLVDLKHTDAEKFREYTHGDIDLVMCNLKKLTDWNNNVVVRVPVIPGFNHTFSEMKKIIDTVATLKNVREINFLPYHTFGVEKYKMLSLDYIFGDKPSVQDVELTEYIHYAISK